MTYRDLPFSQRFHKLGDADAAWAAGFLEADGWFGFHGPSGKATTRSARIEATNTDVRTLDQLTDCLQTGKVYGPIAQRGFGTKPVYKWRLARQGDVGALCVRLRPYLVSYKAVTVDQLIEHLTKGGWL